MMNIYEKISAIMSDVQYLSKDDKVEFGKTKYKAISEEKVTSIMRTELNKYNLIVYPIKQEHKRVDTLSTVDVTYRIVNVENPDEYIEVVSSGTGADTQDKGVGKAMTYAYKYMFLRTFAIPTGEDPDKISSAELDAQQMEKAKEKPSTVELGAIEAICKSHKIDLDKWLESLGTTRETISSETAGQMLRSLKNKYGDK